MPILKGSSPQDHRMAAHNSWMASSLLLSGDNWYTFLANSQQCLLEAHWSESICVARGKEWADSFPPASSTSPLELIPVANPDPGPLGKGRRNGAGMSPTKVNGISLHFASIDQQFLTDFPVRTMAEEEVGREQGEREQSSNCRHSLLEFSKSSLANPKSVGGKLKIVS